MRGLTVAAFVMLVAAPAWAAEKPVDPYEIKDANAGTQPIAGDAVYLGLHERAGIDRIVDGMLSRAKRDPRTAEIFHAADFERLKRTLGEQICYISGGPCHYTGRDMAAAHKDMGLQTKDFNALVEELQSAMDDERVPVRIQNRLLAKLAPMKRVTVER